MQRTTSRPRYPVAAALLLSSSLLAGCGGGGDPEGWDVNTADLLSSNGKSMNGKSMNGKSMNGTDLTGVYVTKVALNPVTVGAVNVTDAVLTASVFSSARAKLSGAAFKGAVFTATLSNGTTLPLTVTAVSALAAPNADVTGYALTYPTSTGAQPLCGLDVAGAPVLAVPMMGTWNMGQGVTGGGSFTSSTTFLTLACRGFAIAKCMELGYKPWATFNGTNLQAYQQTCTRVLRADYCGNGTSYTVDGTVIDIYDRLNLQTDAASTWPVEAEWNPGGATCITPNTFDRFNLLGTTVPPCYPAKTSTTTSCGVGSFTRIQTTPTLIVDRFKQ